MRAAVKGGDTGLAGILLARSLSAQLAGSEWIGVCLAKAAASLCVIGCQEIDRGRGEAMHCCCGCRS